LGEKSQTFPSLQGIEEEFEVYWTRRKVDAFKMTPVLLIIGLVNYAMILGAMTTLIAAVGF
jgi:hypothetical protein